jgi:hypothetical protein
MATPATHISENSYKFRGLKRRENFPLWKIQMRGMYRENDLLGIVSGTEVQPILNEGGTATPNGTIVTQGISVADIAAWDKRQMQALGLMQRRVEEGPMTHIANTEDPHVAWQTLQMMYETIGDAATTLMRQRFYGKPMTEGTALEEHIKVMRSAQEQINLAVATQGGSRITEDKFIQQLVTSLPDSWDILKSVMDYTVQATDMGG